jgi:hypothetical protein
LAAEVADHLVLAEKVGLALLVAVQAVVDQATVVEHFCQTNKEIQVLEQAQADRLAEVEAGVLLQQYRHFQTLMVTVVTEQQTQLLEHPLHTEAEVQAVEKVLVEREELAAVAICLLYQQPIQVAVAVAEDLT